MFQPLAWANELGQKFSRRLGLSGATEAGGGDHLCLYLSNGSLASARLKAADMRVTLRADPLHGSQGLSDLVTEQLDTVKAGRGAGACSLVLAPEFYQLSLLERPDVGDDELVDAMRWRLQDQVDYPVEEAVLDVFNLPANASRDRAMVFVASLRQSLLDNLLEQLNQGGATVAAVDVTELALRNLSWLCFPGADQSVALLRLTRNSGLINVTRGEELYLSRRISGVPDTLSEASWSDFKDKLLVQVQRSIDYYESAMNQSPCQGLLIGATDDWAAPVQAYMSEMLPIPVRGMEDMLDRELFLTLCNPEPQDVDWSHPSNSELNAVAAGLPALGGSLRRHIHREVMAAA